jgi:hypothetical protein
MSEGYKRDEDLEEGKDHPGQTCDEAHEDKEHSLWKEEKLEENDEKDEEEEKPFPPNPNPTDQPFGGQMEENWFKGNKDQLLFESLMKKWCK